LVFKLSDMTVDCELAYTSHKKENRIKKWDFSATYFFQLCFPSSSLCKWYCCNAMATRDGINPPILLLKNQ